MALLPILSFPDPRLRTIAKPVDHVTDEIRQLVADMFETMYAAPGIGLAATQVDRHIQLVVMDLSEEKDDPLVFINPKITPLTEETQPYEEGCLSLPSLYSFTLAPISSRSEVLLLLASLSKSLIALPCQRYKLLLNHYKNVFTGVRDEREQGLSGQGPHR